MARPSATLAFDFMTTTTVTLKQHGSLSNPFSFHPSSGDSIIESIAPSSQSDRTDRHADHAHSSSTLQSPSKRLFLGCVTEPASGRNTSSRNLGATRHIDLFTEKSVGGTERESSALRELQNELSLFIVLSLHFRRRHRRPHSSFQRIKG